MVARGGCGRGVGLVTRRSPRTGVGVGAGWVAWPGAAGVPPRPPVPPQRHDCPRLRGRVPAAAGRRPAAAYGGKGTCRGVFARSGWRVNAPHLFK
ncbi:hypothetical protein B9W62_28130 [Streptomyces sp. CS113]|nr:hypothetical protein B9W62_28130 [Streptomyces sp. CS113]